ncbi:MAG: alpha/beta fold hydrolase [Planctomycetota bacterium]
MFRLVLLGLVAVGCSSPLKLTEHRVTAPDGVIIHCVSAGAGTPALVFVHGWSCDHSYWEAQLPEFAAQHRVVAIDLPGHGRSGRNRQVWNLASYGADVATVLEQLEIRDAVLVGHSMGGPVAVEAARRVPDRVTSIIGIDTLHDIGTKPNPVQWEGQVIASFERDFKGTCARFVRSMFTANADLALVERVARNMSTASPAIAIALLREFGHHDGAAAVSALKIPICCINSDLHPTQIEANRRYAPQFDAHLIAGVGHFPMMERPAEFNKVLHSVLAAQAPITPAVSRPSP